MDYQYLGALRLNLARMTNRNGSQESSQRCPVLLRYAVVNILPESRKPTYPHL
jgi:hypothetical protein